MLNLKKVAVTGKIASGKSTVCHLFEELGAYSVSADELVHQLLVPTTQLGRDIVNLLGADIVVDQTLSRERIAQKVFRQPSLLSAFEKLVHPEVQKIIDAGYETALRSAAPLFIAEVPLLFEAGLESYYDKIIVVVSDEKRCVERFKYNEDEYRRRSQRLMPIEEKIKKADFVIENNGSLENLRQTIQPIFFALKENI